VDVAGHDLGLKTAYELDRVAGRYTLLEDEQNKPRTVYSLARKKHVDPVQPPPPSSAAGPVGGCRVWVPPRLIAANGPRCFEAARLPHRLAHQEVGLAIARCRSRSDYDSTPADTVEEVDYRLTGSAFRVPHSASRVPISAFSSATAPDYREVTAATP